MLLPGLGTIEKGGSKKDCLIVENWMIVADCRPCEALVCCTASPTPATDNTLLSNLLEESDAPTGPRMA